MGESRDEPVDGTVSGQAIVWRCTRRRAERREGSAAGEGEVVRGRGGGVDGEAPWAVSRPTSTPGARGEALRPT